MARRRYGKGRKGGRRATIVSPLTMNKVRSENRSATKARRK